MLQLIAQTDLSAPEIVGSFKIPEGVEKFDQASGGGIGLLVFISNIIQIFTVVAGLWVLFNFLFAGFLYITSDDKGGATKVREKITQSVIGLVIIISAYTVVALLGLILFGNAGYFLQPVIPTPTPATTIIPPFERIQ